MSAQPASSGQLLAAVGLPGCGKSTVMRGLAQLINATVFPEPEESEWGLAVRQRESAGYFTALMWFRSARVPLYFQAEAVRRAGGTAILDTYYDKLCAAWLGKPGMEWLLRPDDPYFQPAMAAARLDRDLLPLADVLVTFELSEPDWRTLVTRRGRDLDRDEGFAKSFTTQPYFAQAAADLSGTTGIRLINFPQTVDSPELAAVRLRDQLRAEGILAG